MVCAGAHSLTLSGKDSKRVWTCFGAAVGCFLGDDNPVEYAIIMSQLVCAQDGGLCDKDKTEATLFFLSKGIEYHR